MTTLWNLFRHCDGSAAIEAAIFLPIFMVLAFGIADLGSQMFLRQQVNAAAQAGASYAVIHNCLSADSCSGIYSAMNDASGNPSFCTDSECDVAITGCTDGSPKCVTVTTRYALTPILPADIYSWAMSMTVSYTVTVRVPVIPVTS